MIIFTRRSRESLSILLCTIEVDLWGKFYSVNLVYSGLRKRKQNEIYHRKHDSDDMSNIYIQEPPTSGKVLIKTTAGEIECELWWDIDASWYLCKLLVLPLTKRLRNAHGRINEYLTQTSVDIFVHSHSTGPKRRRRHVATSSSSVLTSFMIKRRSTDSCQASLWVCS